MVFGEVNYLYLNDQVSLQNVSLKETFYMYLIVFSWNYVFVTMGFIKNDHFLYLCTSLHTYSGAIFSFF